MKDCVNILQKGGLAIIPTDTLYGLVACALNKDAVQKVYEIKKRTPSKPFIILIASIKDIDLFDIELDIDTKNFLHKYWPGKVSVILPLAKVTPMEKYEYLHRGTESLAFRIPDKKELIELIKQTGPLIAPSANPEGEKPAESIEEAKKYFGDTVDVYAEGGYLQGESSTLVEIKDRKIRVVRQGAVKI